MEQKLMSEAAIGIIGGSGIYEMEGVSQIKEIEVSTPFGKPSGRFLTGNLGGKKVAFLPRHGLGHRLLPSELNYRANIFGFKKLGTTHIIAVTAVGSLQENIHPLDMVIPDQLVDRTRNRISTFFGDGIAAHIPFSDPFCPVLAGILYRSASSSSVSIHKGGTLLNIEGPAFSTRAESRLYQKWGIDIIGMTTLQEAKLAREAQICYAALAMVTDYDCWKEDSEAVSVETVVTNLEKNVTAAKKIIQNAVPYITGTRDCLCPESLKGAIMTQMDAIDEATRQKLMPLIKNYV